MSYQCYLGRFLLPNTATQLTIGAAQGYDPAQNATLTLDSTKYYLTDLLAAINAEMVTAEIEGDGGTPLWYYDYSANRVCVDFAGVTRAVVWDNTALRDLLGFEDNLSGDDEYTATLAPRYVWSPSEQITAYSCGNIDAWWSPSSRTIIHRSGEGGVSVVRRGTLYDGTYRYELLPAADVVIDPDVSGWEPLEQFFLDVISLGEPIKCFPDRSAMLSFTAIWPGGGEDGIGSFDDFRSRYLDDFDGLWNVNFGLWKYLAAG